MNIPIQVTSVIVILVFLKTVRFPVKDKSKTLSSIICLSPKEHHKGIKMFANINTLNGVLQNKFNPNIPKNYYFTFSIFSVCCRFFVR